MKSANLSESEPNGAKTSPPTPGHPKTPTPKSVKVKVNTKASSAAALRKISTAMATTKRSKVCEIKSKPPTASAVFHTDKQMSRSHTPAFMKGEGDKIPFSSKIPRSRASSRLSIREPPTKPSTTSSSAGDSYQGSSRLPSSSSTNELPLSASDLEQLKPHGARKMITFYVCTLLGTTITMHLPPSTTIGQIKVKLNDEENIPFDSQVLIFMEKELKIEEMTLEELGIQSGSRIQLVTKMTGGPGANLRTQPVQEDAGVVFLLCKQNDEVFILEVQMDPIKGCKTTAKHVITLAEGTPGAELLKSLNSNECLDLGVLDDIFVGDGDEVPGKENCDDLDAQENDLNSDECDNDREARPRTSDSISSASTFISFITPPDAYDGDSRPSSASTTDELFPVDSDMKELEKLLLTDSEWKAPSTAHSNPIFQIQSSRRIRSCKPRRQRPATAISIMRLPPGTQSMLLIAKSRPASAEKVIQKLIGGGDPKAALVCSTPLAATSTALSHLLRGLSTEVLDKEVNYDSINLEDQTGNLKPIKSQKKPFPKKPIRHILPGRHSLSRKTDTRSQAGDDFELEGTYSDQLLEFKTERGHRERKSISLQKKKRPLSRTSNTTEASALSITSRSNVFGSTRSSVSQMAKTRSQITLLEQSRKSLQPHTSKSNTKCLSSIRSFIPKPKSTNSSTESPRPFSSKKAIGSSKSRVSTPATSSPLVTKSGSSTCFSCQKKLRLAATFKCKCNHVFCSVHRYSDRHSCSFNYKENGRAQLRKENPLVQGERVTQV